MFGGFDGLTELTGCEHELAWLVCCGLSHVRRLVSCVVPCLVCDDIYAIRVLVSCAIACLVCDCLSGGLLVDSNTPMGQWPGRPTRETSSQCRHRGFSAGLLFVVAFPILPADCVCVCVSLHLYPSGSLSALSVDLHPNLYDAFSF